MSVTIYHNSRCSKSRAALALLQERGIAPVTEIDGRTIGTGERGPMVEQLQQLYVEMLENL